MFTLTTSRLILAATPLSVIKTRLQQAEFMADVPVAFTEDGQLRTQVLHVHFPPEWPGDALALFPAWEKELTANPAYEMWGGIMIDRTELVAVGGMTLSRTPGDPSVVELGYGVNPAYQRRGYATEAARTLVGWATREPRISHIMATCLDDNLASIRVLENAGFRQTGERQDEEGHFILWDYPQK